MASQPPKTRPPRAQKSDETNPIEILFATPASKNKANQTQFFGFVAWALVPAASTIVSTPRGGAEGFATLRGDPSRAAQKAARKSRGSAKSARSALRTAGSAAFPRSFRGLCCTGGSEPIDPAKSADLNREMRAAGGVWKQSEMIRQSA